MQWCMNVMKRWSAVAVCLVAMSASAVQAQVVIKGAGASFPSRVYERWAQRFMEVKPGASISYTPTGSGDGVKQAKARTVQIAGSDHPLTPQQLAENNLVQIPMLIGGLVPVVNLPGIGNNRLILSGEVLAEIMLGDIARWNDRRIAELNPGVNLPALPIVRVVRSDASGSTEVWTRYLGNALPRFAQAVPAGQKPNWPGVVQAAKGNDGVAEQVKTISGAISYVSYDRVVKDKLVATRLRSVTGDAVEASEAGFRAAILGSDVYRKGDDTASLLNSAKLGAWPITMTSYVLLDARPKDMKTADWTARFVFWCFMQGDELTRGTGFAPMPDRVQAKLSGRLLEIHGPAGELPKFQ